MVAAYAFDEGSGTTVGDASGKGNVGTINGADWAEQGKFGHALSFNGTNALVVVNFAQSLNLSAAMTEEAWVYPTATQSSWSTILHRETDAYYLHASSPAGPMYPAGGGIFNGTEQYSAATNGIPLNTWTHLATTYDGTTLKIYVNGAMVSTKSVSGVIQTNSNPLRIGGNVPYGQYFQGMIDEVRVYNRALPQSEIQSNMNQSLAAPRPALPTKLHPR
jgi:hypothetical protein